jgi:molybdopterin synthase catalytic subunit
MIKVQTEPFDLTAEVEALTKANTSIGAVVTFTGLVRDNAEGALKAMTLEHYPGMTEKQLAEIEKIAHERWPLQACLIIHRYGRLEPGEPIVLVVTASSHRQAAFEAAEFLMDWLKTKAPFWKLEETSDASIWVEAKSGDHKAAKKWD